jgi:hypothetical protein
MDDFSEQCAGELLAVFPDSRPHMRVESRDDGSSYFVVECRRACVTCFPDVLTDDLDSDLCC